MSPFVMATVIMESFGSGLERKDSRLIVLPVIEHGDVPEREVALFELLMTHVGCPPDNCIDTGI